MSVPNSANLKIRYILDDHVIRFKALVVVVSVRVNRSIWHHIDIGNLQN